RGHAQPRGDIDQMLAPIDAERPLGWALGRCSGDGGVLRQIVRLLRSAVVYERLLWQLFGRYRGETDVGTRLQDDRQ
ncbi:hypothetical protein DK27_03400, partial [Xanthomonas arboricola pv. pruni]